jgi:hypothetical protein
MKFLASESAASILRSPYLDADVVGGVGIKPNSSSAVWNKSRFSGGFSFKTTLHPYAHQSLPKLPFTLGAAAAYSQDSPPTTLHTQTHLQKSHKSYDLHTASLSGL